MVSLALQTHGGSLIRLRGLPGSWYVESGFSSFGPQDKKVKEKIKKSKGMKDVKTTSGGHSNLQPTQGPQCHREGAWARGADASPYLDSRSPGPYSWA